MSERVESYTVCPVCSVSICKYEDGTEAVFFSHGAPGTRQRLAARVCQYAKNKADCINKQTSLSEASHDDFYHPI
jgi:hypothetical protein